MQCRGPPLLLSAQGCPAAGLRCSCCEHRSQPRDSSGARSRVPSACARDGGRCCPPERHHRDDERRPLRRICCERELLGERRLQDAQLVHARVVACKVHALRGLQAHAGRRGAVQRGAASAPGARCRALQRERTQQQRQRQQQVRARLRGRGLTRLARCVSLQGFMPVTGSPQSASFPPGQKAKPTTKAPPCEAAGRLLVQRRQGRA